MSLRPPVPQLADSLVYAMREFGYKKAEATGASYRLVPLRWGGATCTLVFDSLGPQPDGVQRAIHGSFSPGQNLEVPPDPREISWLGNPRWCELSCAAWRDLDVGSQVRQRVWCHSSSRRESSWRTGAAAWIEDPLRDLSTVPHLDENPSEAEMDAYRDRARRAALENFRSALTQKLDRAYRVVASWRLTERGTVWTGQGLESGETVLIERHPSETSAVDSWVPRRG